MAAQAAGWPLVQPRDEIAQRVSAQHDQSARKGGQDTLLRGAMLRWAWDLDPGLLA